MTFCVSRAAAGVTNSSAEEWSLFLRHSLTSCLILSDFAGASEIWSLVERSAKSEISSFTASVRDFEALLSVAAVSGSRQDATQILHKMKRLNLNVVNNSSNDNSSSSNSSISSIDSALWPPSSSCVAFAMQSLARNGIPYRSISLFEDHFSNARNDNLDKARLSLALCTLAASAETFTTIISSSSHLKQGQLLIDLADEAWKSLQAAYSLHDDSHLSSQIPVAAHCALIEAARRSQSKEIAALWLDRFRKGLAMRNKERDLKNHVLDNATTPLANSQWGPDTLVSSLPFSSTTSSSSFVTTLQTPRLSDFVDDIVRVSNHPLSPFVSAARSFLDSLPQSPDNGADRVIEIFQLAVKDGVPVDDSGWWDDLLIVTATAEALSGRSAQGIASLQIRDLLKRAANDAGSNIAAGRPTSSRPWHKMAFPLVRCAGMFRNSPHHQGAEIENLAGDVLSCLRLITGRVPRMIHEARAASAADAGDVDSALLVIDSLAEDKVAASPYMFESVFEACLKAQSGHALGRASAQYALARFVASGMHPTPRISALLKRIDERFVAEEEEEKEARRALSISKLRRRGLRGSRIINQRFGGRQRSELMEEDDAAGDSVETKKRLDGEMNTIPSSDPSNRTSSESVIPSNEEIITEKKKEEVEKEDLSSVGSEEGKPEELVAVALPSSEDDEELSAFRSALQREELENKDVGFSIHDRSDEAMEMEEEVEDLNISLNDDELARFSIIRASRDCGLRLNNRDSRILRALKAADEQDSGFEEADELKSDDSSVDGEGSDVMQYSEEAEDDEVVLDGHKPLPAYMLGGSSSAVEDHGDNNADNNVREAVATSSSKDAAPSRESSAKQLARAFAQRRRNVTGLEVEET